MIKIPKSNKKLVIIFILILILVTTGISLYLSRNQQNQKTLKMQEKLEAFQLYVYQKNEIIRKEVFLSHESNELKKMEKIVESFISNLEEPFHQVKLIGLFRDKENKIYLDFSTNLALPMDAKEEFYLLKSLYLTLKSNFNWISDVKLLIGSSEKETLSGHVLINSLKEAAEGN